MDTIIKTKGLLCLRFLPLRADRPCYGLLEVDLDQDVLKADNIKLDDDISRRKYLADLKGRNHVELSEYMKSEITSGMDAIVAELNQGRKPDNGNINNIPAEVEQEHLQ